MLLERFLPTGKTLVVSIPLILNDQLAGTTGLEPATSCVTGSMGLSISLLLRHTWQRKGTKKHAQNGEVVLIWYSF